jgi:hypothetical protein
MRTHNKRIRQGLRIEWLEERNAPSRGASLATALETLHHHATGREHAGRVHDVRALHHGGHGKDDGANHNVNDQRGGQGKDDPANHDKNDNKGVTLMNGKDDPANHDQNDNKGVTPVSDDPANHDVNDQNDGHGHDDKGGHH